MKHGTAEFMREYGQGLGLVVFTRLFLQPVLCIRITPQEQNSSFTKGPSQIGIADLPASRAIGFTGRLFLAFDPEKGKQLT